MIKLLELFNEIKVNNPLPDSTKIAELWMELYDAGDSNLKILSDLRKLSKEYFPNVDPYEYIEKGDIDEIPKSAQISYYNELSSLKKKYNINEIKVNNPNEVFQVTKEGEQAYKDYHTLHKLVVKYVTEDHIGIFDNVEDSSRWWDLLNFSIMLDEKLIKIGIINQNKDYLDKAINDIGWEAEDALKYLEGIKKQGWIK